MATMKWTGLDEYIAKLERIHEPREFIGETVYVGAAVVADAVKAQINGLPVGNQFAKSGERINTITSVQKKGLQDGFGIARMKKDGDFYNVKLGFNGYNGQKTKKYPSGQPNSVIARSLCSGTSFRQKNDFVGRAVRATRAQAEQAMEKKLDEILEKRMN